MLFVVSATTETGTAQGTGACLDSVSYFIIIPQILLQMHLHASLFSLNI